MIAPLALALLGFAPPATEAAPPVSTVKPLPVLVATSSLVTWVERGLADPEGYEWARRLEGRDYVLVDFKEFRLAYHPDVLGLGAARRQMAVMRECAERVKAGAPTIEVASLSPEDQTTLRTMVARSPVAAVASLAGSPTLRFKTGLKTEFDVEYHGQRETATVLPRGPSHADALQQCTPVPAEKPKPWPAPPSDGSTDAGQLTFVFPADEPRLDARMRWSAEAQAYLQKLATETKAGYQSLASGMVDALEAQDPERYGRFPTDRKPGFGDLGPESQLSVEQFFRGAHRRDGFGDMLSVDNFLRNGRTVDSRTRFTLSVYVIMDRQEHYTSEAVSNLVFSCPIGP